VDLKSALKNGAFKRVSKRLWPRPGKLTAKPHIYLPQYYSNCHLISLKSHIDMYVCTLNAKYNVLKVGLQKGAYKRYDTKKTMS